MSDETEFQRRRNMPGVEVRYMSAGRTFDVVLSLCGREIGWRTDIRKRGKVVSSTFILPKMEL